MSKQSFLIQLILFFALFVGINVVVARLSHTSVAWQVISKAKKIDAEGGAEELFVGNSLVQAGLDASAFEKAWTSRKVSTVGLGSTSPLEHVILIGKAGNEKARINYCFFDGQLTEEPSRGWADLVGNRALAYYMDPAVAVPLYFPHDSLAALQMRAVAAIPVIVHRQALWARVERWRLAAAAIGVGKRESVNQFGRVAAFAEMAEGNKNALLDEIGHSEVAPVFNNAVQRIVDIAHQRDVPLQFILMPMPTAHRQALYETRTWQQYEVQLRTLVQQSGAVFIDASKWMPDSAFADALHLSSNGAVDFSHRLAIQMRDLDMTSIGSPP